MILTKLVSDAAREHLQGQKIALGDALHVAQQQVEHQVHAPVAQLLDEGVRHHHLLHTHAPRLARARGARLDP